MGVIITMTAEIVNSDALTALQNLESQSVDMCMTSPPYWALRDYGHKDQRLAPYMLQTRLENEIIING